MCVRARTPTPTHTHTQQIGVGVFRDARLCFTMELVAESLKCLFELTQGVPALVV